MSTSFLWAIAKVVVILSSQAEKVRQEKGDEDISMLQALSIVLDRRSDLRFLLTLNIYLINFFVSKKSQQLELM